MYSTLFFKLFKFVLFETENHSIDTNFYSKGITVYIYYHNLYLIFALALQWNCCNFFQMNFLYVVLFYVCRSFTEK